MSQWIVTRLALYLAHIGFCAQSQGWARQSHTLPALRFHTCPIAGDTAQSVDSFQGNSHHVDVFFLYTIDRRPGHGRACMFGNRGEQANVMHGRIQPMGSRVQLEARGGGRAHPARRHF